MIPPLEPKVATQIVPSAAIARESKLLGGPSLLTRLAFGSRPRDALSVPGESMSHLCTRPVVVSATTRCLPPGESAIPLGVISGCTTSVIDDPSGVA